MATKFDNKAMVHITDANPTDIITCPIGSTIVITGFNISNVDTIDIENVDVSIYNSFYNDTFKIVKGVPIGLGSAFVPIGNEQKHNLTANDKFIVTSNNGNLLDVIVSYLEIT